MTRLAATAVLGLLAATPASARCQPAADLVAGLRQALPAHAVVRAVSRDSVPAVLAWLESEGRPLPGVDGLVQVSGDRGIALVPTRAGQVCDGAGVVVVLGGKAGELVGLVRRYREMRGWGPEVEA